MGRWVYKHFLVAVARCEKESPATLPIIIINDLYCPPFGVKFSESSELLDGGPSHVHSNAPEFLMLPVICNGLGDALVDLSLSLSARTEVRSCYKWLTTLATAGTCSAWKGPSFWVCLNENHG